MHMQMNDEALIIAVKKGENTAFDQLVLKYQHKVGKIVGRYISENSEIADVTQEVFIKAFRAVKRFRGDSAFYTWLYRIAINTAKNHSLGKIRRPPGSDIDVEEAERQSYRTVLKEDASPEHMLLRDEIQSVLNDTFEHLPENLRTAIILREIEGLSYDTIAEVMDCPVGTIRSRIFRAREVINSKVNPLLEDSSAR